jgi:hypothetical protein
MNTLDFSLDNKIMEIEKGFEEVILKKLIDTKIIYHVCEKYKSRVRRGELDYFVNDSMKERM